MKINKITIRVYGLLINEKNEILLSDEFGLSRFITKLPGGGLEPGESTIDCLKREFIEEFNQEIEVENHFHTTDFFQQAYEIQETQIICVYYFVKIKGEFKIQISQKPFDKEGFKSGDQTVRWFPLSNISEEVFSLPTDKKVGSLLSDLFKNS